MYSRGGDGASSVVNEAAVDTLVPGEQDTGRGAAGGRSGFPADSPRAAAPQPLSVRAPVSFLLRCIYTWKPSMNLFCSEGHGDGRGGRGALRPSVSGVRPKCFFSFFQGKNKMISVLLGRGDVRMLLFLFPFVVVWHFFLFLQKKKKKKLQDTKRPADPGGVGRGRERGPRRAGGQAPPRLSPSPARSHEEL